MGYNRENFNRVREEYDKKYMNARRAANERLFEVHARIPEIMKIDRILGETGAKIMSIICSGDTDTKEKIESTKAAILQKEEQYAAEKAEEQRRP